MKRTRKFLGMLGLLALLVVAASPAKAAFVVGGENGWQMSFDGMINAFMVWSTIDNRSATAWQTANVVGPVCETGDTFATARSMDRLDAGDLLVFRTAGAYAAAMSSTYNSRPLTPEVLVDGDRWAVVRPRIDVDRLIAAESLPAWLSGCASADTG